MPPNSLKQMCNLVSDVAIGNAKTLRQKFNALTGGRPVYRDDDFLLKTFSFMNWTFAQGIWTNLQNTQLRRDLLVHLKDCFIIKLAPELTESKSVEDMAAKAVFLTEEFNSYLMRYKSNMKNMGYADTRTATLFALEQIQEKLGLDDSDMDEIVPSLFSDEKLNSEVESVAMEVNKAAENMEPKGFYGRFFYNLMLPPCAPLSHPVGPILCGAEAERVRRGSPSSEKNPRATSR